MHLLRALLIGLGCLFMLTGSAFAEDTNEKHPESDTPQPYFVAVGDEHHYKPPASWTWGELELTLPFSLSSHVEMSWPVAKRFSGRGD